MIHHSSCVNAPTVFLAALTIGPIPVITARPADTPRLPDQKDTAAFTRDLEITIRRLLDKGRIPGLQIALIQDGNTLWNKSLGVKNTDVQNRVTGETIFAAALITEPMVMRLVDE